MKYRYKLERRKTVPLWIELAAVVGSLVVSLGVGAVLVLQSHTDLGLAYTALFQGAFGSREAILETLVQATPLIFTGLAMVVAYRANYINLGAEGQFLFGAIAATGVSLALPSAPRGVVIPLQILAGCLAGAAWAFIPAVLKVRFGSSEIIVTVMLNSVADYFLSYLVSGPWKNPADYYNQTAIFAPAAHWPTLFSSRLHIGLVLGLVAALLVYYILWKTRIGYELRAVGENPVASRYKGISVNLIAIIAMSLSGALAGLGGVGEVCGIHHRLRAGLSKGYGWTGLTIALVAGLQPLGTVVAAILFGGLINGSSYMRIVTGVETALADAFQGIALVVVLVLMALVRFRVRRIPTDA